MSEQEKATKYGISYEEWQKVGQRYEELSEGGILIITPSDPDQPNPPGPTPPPTTAFTNFKYKFGKHKSKGKMRNRDTFYGEFAALNIEVGSTLTVFGEEGENDEIDFKLGGGEHTDDKAAAGKCYCIGTHFDGAPFFAKEYPEHPKTANFSDKVQIISGPKKLGNMRSRRFKMIVKKYIYKKKNIRVECWIDLFDGKGLFHWFNAVDDGDLVGEPYTQLHAEQYGSKDLVYLRIDSITKKTVTEGMYAIDITKSLPGDEEPDEPPGPGPGPDVPPEPPNPDIPPIDDIDAIAPKYQRKVGGPYYRLPKTGNINDGIRIDKGAEKWDLDRNVDGSVVVNGKTIRLKVFADKYLTQDEIISAVESVNPKWDYAKARALGYWLPANIPQWRNVEVTLTFVLRKSPRKDPFIGIVVRSCIHDNADDEELKGHELACHGGSSYHSNVAADHLEEKGEGLHVKYFDMENFIKKIPKFNGSIINQKVSMKYCLYNAIKDGKPIVKSETYFKWTVNGKWELSWEGYYTGDEQDNVAGLITWGSCYVILKSNDSVYDLYDLEIAEIVPPTS